MNVCYYDDDWLDFFGIVIIVEWRGSYDVLFGEWRCRLVGWCG